MAGKSAFIAAMDDANNNGNGVTDCRKRLGENASPEYTAKGVEDPRVALFFALVRQIDQERLHPLMWLVLSVGKDSKDDTMKILRGQMAADIMVMAFQTRNCRGGKGERDLFFHMLLKLHETFPKTVCELIKLIPSFGSYRDWFRLIAMANETSPSNQNNHVMVETILESVKDQLLEDKSCLGEDNAVKPSLLAKWAPREKGAFGKQVGMLAKKIFPNSSTPKKDYRKLVASINRALDTTEIRMCAKEWDGIAFASVPSLCMMKHRKAFLNERLDRAPTAAEDDTGNRHPSDPVRVQCRKRLRETMLHEGGKKIKGKQLFPHEITDKLMNQSRASSGLERDLLELQWNSIRSSVQEAMETMKTTSQEDEEGSRSKKVDLGKLVAMADVSGSMSGIPMSVSIALSILVSELSDPTFANRFLTFSESPTWVVFEDGMALAKKVQTTRGADWGYSTDFEAALELILQTAVKAKLSPEDIPDLIVFSDMQFNQARRCHGQHGWETHHERLVRHFRETGVKVCGKPWSVPHVIFWNLRGDTNGFPAQAHAEGVTMLSGYSPSLLKLLLSGGDMEVEVVKEEVMADGSVVVTKETKQKTPYDTLRNALDDTQYDSVREVLARSTEGALVDFSWEPLATQEDEWVM